MAKDVATKRRTRIKRTAVVIPSQDKSKYTRMVNEYFELETQIADKQARMEEIRATMFDSLKEVGLKEWKGEHGDAIIETPVGNARTVVNPYAFRERVTDDEFMESVTVGVTAAKKVLSGKELEAVSETTPGAKKDPVCRFVRHKEKTKKK